MRWRRPGFKEKIWIFQEKDASDTGKNADKYEAPGDRDCASRYQGIKRNIWQKKNVK